MTLFRCSASGVQPSGRSWSFRMYFNSGHTVAQIEADWLAHIDGAWIGGASALQALFPVATILETTRSASLQVVSVSTTAGPIDKLREVLVVSDNPALPGTATNPSLPDQNAILVSLRTGLPGRENRGRVHLPAPDQTLVVASELTAVAAGHVSTAMNGLITNMGASGHQAVLATAVKPKTGTAVGSTRNIVNAETDRVIRTMRTRNKREKAVYV